MYPLGNRNFYTQSGLRNNLTLPKPLLLENSSYVILRTRTNDTHCYRGFLSLVCEVFNKNLFHNFHGSTLFTINYRMLDLIRGIFITNMYCSTSETSLTLRVDFRPFYTSRNIPERYTTTLLKTVTHWQHLLTDIEDIYRQVFALNICSTIIQCWFSGSLSLLRVKGVIPCFGSEKLFLCHHCIQI